MHDMDMQVLMLPITKRLLKVLDYEDGRCVGVRLGSCHQIIPFHQISAELCER